MDHYRTPRATKYTPKFLHGLFDRLSHRIESFKHPNKRTVAAGTLALALAGCGTAESTGGPNADTVTKTVDSDSHIDDDAFTTSPSPETTSLEATSSPEPSDSSETKKPGIASQLEMIDALQPNTTIEALATNLNERVDAFYIEGAYAKESQQPISERYPGLIDRMNEHRLAAIQQLSMVDLHRKKMEIDHIAESQLLTFDENGVLLEQPVTIDKVRNKETNEVGIPFDASVTDYLNQEWYPEGIQSIESELIAKQLLIDATNSSTISQLDRLNEQVNAALAEYVSDGVTLEMQRIEDELPTQSGINSRTATEAKHYVTEQNRLQAQTNIDIHEKAVLENGFTGSVDNGYIVAANTYYIDHQTGKVDPAVTPENYEATEHVTPVQTVTLLGEYTDDAGNITDARLETSILVPVDKISTRDDNGEVIITEDESEISVITFRYDTLETLVSYQ